MKMKVCYTPDQSLLILKKINNKDLSLYLRDRILMKFKSAPTTACEPCKSDVITKYIKLQLPAEVEISVKSAAATSGLTPSEYIRRIFIEPLLLE